MKKSLVGTVLAVSIAGCLALTACSSGSSNEPAQTEGENQPVQAQQGEQKAAKYEVSIDDCAVTADYTGASAIVVTYTWTNNSDKATMFDVAISADAYQNGVELDFGTISSSDTNFDTRSAMKEIKPGATQTVQKAYLLSDESEVTVECTQLISFDDTILAEKTFSVA